MSDGWALVFFLLGLAVFGMLTAIFTATLAVSKATTMSLRIQTEILNQLVKHEWTRTESE